MLRLYNLSSDGELTPVTVTDCNATFLGVPQDLINLVENNPSEVGKELYAALYSRWKCFQLVNIGKPYNKTTWEVEIVNSFDTTTFDTLVTVTKQNTLQGVL